MRFPTACAVVAISALSTSCAVLSERRPLGEAGPNADAMARAIEARVNRAAWEQTKAVRWTFRGKHQHLWDRARGLIRVAWDDVAVMRPIDRREGVACREGKRVEGEEQRELLDAAYAKWVNDSFWLNPLVKLFDPGVVRAVAKDSDGVEGLLVTYTSGGLTPGDAYFWALAEDGRPRFWKMWVSTVPVGGVRATWERWITLETGAEVATFHDIGPVDLELTDVAGAATLEALEGEDPFAPVMSGSRLCP